jgi:hypothetical protein
MLPPDIATLVCVVRTAGTFGVRPETTMICAQPRPTEVIVTTLKATAAWSWKTFNDSAIPVSEESLKAAHCYDAVKRDFRSLCDAADESGQVSRETRPPPAPLPAFSRFPACLADVSVSLPPPPLSLLST